MLLKGILAVLLAGILSVAHPVFHVARVIDGDTLLLSNGERVRLIGVDTPELYHPLKPVQYFAKEASEFTRRMAEGKRVRLEFDWQNRDRYGRLLAYVYLQDSTFLNAEIIKQGYGFAYTKYPFRFMEEFRQYENEARENRRGLWKRWGRTKQLKNQFERLDEFEISVPRLYGFSKKIDFHSSISVEMATANQAN